MPLMTTFRQTLLCLWLAGACHSSSSPQLGPDGGESEGRCMPDTKICVDDTVHACARDGTPGPALETCAPGACLGGACLSPCQLAETRRTHYGCRFVAVDLD